MPEHRLPSYDEIGHRLPRYTRKKSAPALRPPPERLSRRADVLPAPSSRSPFDDIDRSFTVSSPAVPGRRAVGRPRTMKSNNDIQRLHNVGDSRMHVSGGGSLGVGGKSVAVGSAAGLIAIAACVIM